MSDDFNQSSQRRWQQTGDTAEKYRKYREMTIADIKSQ